MPYTFDDIVPCRIFLDTGAFQAIADCGGYVFGEGPFPVIEESRPDAVPQVLKRPDGRATIDSLRAIFAFNDRAQFNWIVAPSSLAEIDAANDHWRSRYARDIMDHSNICLAENPPTGDAGAMTEIVKGLFFGNISPKDRKLLLDAAAADCDHFLTIEKRLPRQAHVVLRFIPLVICSPCDFWRKLEPHIRGL